MFGSNEMSFHCPRCDGLSGVAETRGQIRERFCKSCNYVFLTKEVECDESVKLPLRQRTEYNRAYWLKLKAARAEALSS